MDWSVYSRLTFEYPSDGVLLIKINRPGRLNAMDEVLHTELSRVWLDVDRDDACRAVVITGEGKAFSAGGDFEMVEATLGSFRVVSRLLKEAADIVHNITDCTKPIISAINGTAVGAGLAVALTADISIAAESARLTDGHLKLGVAAGDHAAIIWPLLCGLAKARYYLLTSGFIDGREAERIGLVSRCTPDDELMPTALQIAEDFFLGGVQDADLERGTGLRLVEHVLEPAPSGFQFLERRVVQHFAQLDGYEVVNLSDARVDGGFGVPGEGHRTFQDLGDELLHHVLAALGGASLASETPSLHYLIEQATFGGLFRGSLSGGRLCRLSHWTPPSSPDRAPCGVYLPSRCS